MVVQTWHCNYLCGTWFAGAISRAEANLVVHVIATCIASKFTPSDQGALDMAQNSCVMLVVSIIMVLSMAGFYGGS